MTRKRIARISHANGIQQERGTGFAWDLGIVAFGDPIAHNEGRAERKRKIYQKQKEKQQAKKKLFSAGHDL